MQIHQRIDLMRQLPLLNPADQLWTAIAKDASAGKLPEPIIVALSGRRWGFSQRRLPRLAAIAAALFIMGAALLLVSRSGLAPGDPKGELNLAGYLDLVGAVAAAEPALREFPVAPGFTEASWPEAGATIGFPVIAPEILPGGYKLTAVRLYSFGGLRALQFKYRGEQSALCVFQLPTGSKLSFGEEPLEQCLIGGVYCRRANSQNCMAYRFALGETQFALVMRQTDPAVVEALIQAFSAKARINQSVASSAASQSDKRQEPLQQAAEFKLPDLDGRQISSADLRGGVVVLDFWATWCGPCLAEIPTLNRLREKYASRGVKVVGIAAQSGWAEDIKPSRDQYKISYPILIGDDEVVEKYGVIGFPTTYILDKDFKVHRKFTGKLPVKEELEREIESLLADR
jgi:thiol-disulfide isomerase/thioredoxin